MKTHELKVGESIEIGGAMVTVVRCGLLNEGGNVTELVTITIDNRTHKPEATKSATYESLGLSKSIVSKLLDASRRAEMSALANPQSLAAWIAEGNDISDAVSGIGDQNEKLIVKALAKLSKEQA